MTLTEVFSSIANAIRSKTGKTDLIKPVDMATEIDSIQTGSGGNPMQEVVDNHEGDGKPGAKYLFYNYKGTSLNNVIKTLDFSKVTNMANMFSGCINLTSIPVFDTSSVTDMSNMFNSCKKLTTISQLDTSSVIFMASAFAYCSQLTTIPQLDTSRVGDMSYMFRNCSNLTSIPQLDTSNVTSMNYMFSGCNNLEEIHMTGMRADFSISSSTKFTESALVEILNNLATVTSTKTLTMGSTNLAKLTDAEKAIATNKGWTLA